MDSPIFIDGQFVNADLLNAAVQKLLSDIGEIGNTLHTPGLLDPSALTFTPSGMTVTINAPDPFAVLFGTGYVVDAHGTVDGADTTQYSVNLTSLVPGTGTRLVYVVASYTTIGENLTTVVGPPPGHPDYNPKFQPFEFYTTQRATLALAATTTAPDNSTTFELFRITLSAGQNTIQPNQIIIANQVYASAVLSPTGVTAGTYQGATVTVDKYGRVTGASQVLYGPLAGNNTWTGTNTFSKELTAAGLLSNALDAGGAGGQFRAISGQYGVMLRNDGGSAYLLQTAAGTPGAGFSTLRPFAWNLGTGAVTIDGTGAGTTFGGTVTAQGNIQAAGAVTGASASFSGSLGAGSATINGALSAGSISAGSANISGTATANAARLGLGARGSGDGNRVVNLNDFTFSGVVGTFYEILPNGLIIQGFGGAIGALGTGTPYSQVFNLPIAYPNNILFTLGTWGGVTPPNTGTIAAQVYSPSQVEISINAPAGPQYGFTCISVGY